MSLPGFLLALMLMVMAFDLFGLPLFGLFSRPFRDAPWSLAKFGDLWQHLWIPVVVVAINGTAGLMRVMRGNLLVVLGQPFVQTARAKGASQRRVMVQHVLRNSMLPVVTILGMDLGLALGGAIFTEGIFNLPGLGHEIVRAYNFNDLPVITGIVVFSTICVIVFNFIVDVTYGFLDPRIRPT